MPKFTIELDSETHRILKENAKKDERSLTQYMQRILRQSAGTLTINTIDPQLTISNNTITQQSNQINSTTNPPQQQKIRKNVVVGAEFDEELQEARSKWM